MKIKKEAFRKTTKFADNGTYQKIPNDELEHDSVSIDDVQVRHDLVPVSVVKETSDDGRVKLQGNSSSSREPWQQTGILRQVLLSTNSSGTIEKSEPTDSVECVLPKIRDDLLPSVDIKLENDLPSVSIAISGNSHSHETFSPTNDFSTPLRTLPSVSPQFSSMPFSALSASSNCSETSEDSALPLMTSLEPCEGSLQSSSNNILSNSSTDATSNPDTGSSATAPGVDSISSSLVSAVATYSTPPSNLCQALASLTSKDETVTVVYSSIPKVEPLSPNLIHNFQKNAPLPPMSEVKSSLTNHLGILSQSENKSSPNDLHGKISDTLHGIPSSSDSHNESMNFESLPSSEENEGLSTLKLNEPRNPSEFGGESIPLSSEAVKFGRDNTDITSNIVIPVSSDIILAKIAGPNTTSQQDNCHIITIPLPACTIYNSSLSIPMPLPLCNGSTPGTGNVQMSSAVVSNLPYSIAGIPNQASNSCWPNTTVSMSVASSSNSQMSTLVTTSLPLSIMSVAPSISSLQNNNMIHFTSNSISLPSSSQVSSTSVSGLAQDVCYTVQSPAEILSQLSKAGVLPTMSSSQVSSVLSALGPDSHVDIESDSTNQNEILGSQVLPGGFKVSTLTQTDSLEMSMMQHDEKIIQLLSGQQLLDHQVNGSQLIMSAANQNEALNSDTSLNNAAISTTDITEPKRVSPPFPKIVSMLLNAPTTRTEKLCVSDSVEGEFKKNEIQSSNIIINSNQRTKNSSDSLHNFLVLPQVSKQQHKRPKRPSALRKMLLGINDPSDKDSLGTKPKGKSKKNKNDFCGNEHSLKIVKTDSLCNKVVNNSFTKETGCYKCKYCPFLSIEETNMMLHVKLKHSSNEQEVNISRQELKCPGCPNVFFTTHSLQVHLIQDHQVNTPELKAITNSVIKVSAEKKINVSPGKKKKKNSTAETSVSSITTANEISPVVIKRSSNTNKHEVEALTVRTKSNNESIFIESNKKLLVKNINQDLNNKSSYNFRNFPVSNDYEKSQQNNESKEPLGILNSSKNNAANLGIPKDDGKSGDSKIDAKVPVVGQKRKRGRPKGLRSSVPLGMDKDGIHASKYNNSGHRCNVDYCAITMKTPENIEYHRRCHSGAEFHCPECGHRHCHWNGMCTHLWRAHMVDMELYTCDQCNYKTVSYAKLINLHKWIHGSERPFLCDSCGKGFKNRKQLRNHKTIHQPKKMKIGECEVCGRTFTNTRMLRMHLDNVHNKIRPHLCNYCGYSASSVSSLKMHMRKHTGEKPFRCSLCEYATADHNSFRRHKMRHTGDKPYKCPHCPYASIQSSTYKAHLKTKHPGMDDGLMFSCSYCTFRSVKEENYLAHIAEHKPTFGFPLGKDDIKKVSLQPYFESEDITGDISEAELITGD